MSRLLVILGLVAVLILADKPERTLFWDTAFDAGHVPLFGLMALMVRGLLGGTPARAVRASWMAFAITVGIGALAELAQVVMPGRDASWGDLARNAAGAAAFLLAGHAWGSARAGKRWRRVATAVIVLGLLASALSELAAVSMALVARRRAFPTLAAFDGSRWERRFVHVDGGTLQIAGPTHPRGFARLDLQPGPYPGFRVDEPFPDWRGYATLVIPVYSDLAETLPLTVRIHDARHDQRHGDRYNETFAIRPGLVEIRVPLDRVRRAPDTRELDLSRVRGLIGFVHGLDHAVHLYLGPIRLE